MSDSVTAHFSVRLSVSIGVIDEDWVKMRTGTPTSRGPTSACAWTRRASDRRVDGYRPQAYPYT